MFRRETYGTFLIYGHRPMVGYRSPKPLIRVRVLVPVQINDNEFSRFY